MSWLHGSGVCFTGKAYLAGKLVPRDKLDRLVRSQGGIHYETYSGQIDILVASRTDTSKWDKAIAAGKRAITYDEMWQMLGVTSHDELDALLDDDFDPIRAQRLREQAEAEERAANRRAELKAQQEERDRALADAEANIEGWGTF